MEETQHLLNTDFNLFEQIPVICLIAMAMMIISLLMPGGT